MQIQDAEAELSATATLEHGSISISTTETALNIYLSEKLRAFHTEYPGIRLRISNHSTPQAVQAVKNGEVDFAIVTTPAESEPGLKTVELQSFYEILVGGNSFRTLADHSLTLKELSAYPLISLGDESMTRSFYRQFFLDHDALLRPDTEAATTDQMLTLVKSELGLAFVPEPMAQEPLARGEIVRLHLRESSRCAASVWSTTPTALSTRRRAGSNSCLRTMPPKKSTHCKNRIRILHTPPAGPLCIYFQSPAGGVFCRRRRGGEPCCTFPCTAKISFTFPESVPCPNGQGAGTPGRALQRAFGKNQRECRFFLQSRK